MSARPHVPQLRETPLRDISWQEQAACSGLPSEVFFPDRSANITAGARRVCAACPVSGECLSYALGNGEWYGIWGGLSVDQRLELRRKRRASQRRKQASA